MSELPDDEREMLEDMYGSVRATFTMDHVPQGGAPEFIKEQWLGIKLPVRAANLGETALLPYREFDHIRQVISENDSPVAIAGIDAVHALRAAGKEKAANFWEPYQFGKFVFRAHEGLLEPLDPDTASY